MNCVHVRRRVGEHGAVRSRVRGGELRATGHAEPGRRVDVDVDVETTPRGGEKNEARAERRVGVGVGVARGGR